MSESTRIGQVPEHDHVPPSWHMAAAVVRAGVAHYYLKTSGGNDSIALAWHMHTLGLLAKCILIYCDTGWHSHEWPERVSAVRTWAMGLGAVELLVVDSVGMEALVLGDRLIWPNRRISFCTAELKIKPATRALGYIDPQSELTGVIGVRREESANRASHPEHISDSDADGGRDLWAPLVRMTEPERDLAVAAAGWELLTHRSMDCEACHNRGRAGRRLITPGMVGRIRAVEAHLESRGPGRYLYTIRSGGADKRVPIDEAMAWAQSAPRQHTEGQTSLCTGGWCDT